MGVVVAAILGLGLIFYGVYGEDGFLALGLSAPFYAGVAVRIAILTRLTKRVANSPADLKIVHALVLGGCFYFLDFKTIFKEHWPEVYAVGLILTYVGMGVFLYQHDLRLLKSKRLRSEKPASDSSPSDEQ